MNILILNGSPHKNGTSVLLAEKFTQGAMEAGNKVLRFDAAFENVHPCIGCDTCQCGKNPCVFNDDMTELYAELLKADMVVFLTPLYYHAMSAQIKTVIDRFHGIDDLLRSTDKKAMLIVSAASTEKHIMDGVVGSYRETTHYLGWQDAGIFLSYGCYSRTDMEKTDYAEKAYLLGRSVR